MKTIRYMFLIIAVVMIPMLIFSGCKRSDAERKVVITIKGSDTMVNLSQKWAEEFMKKENGYTIQVTGGGSGTGVAALIDGTTNIANSSRELKEAELQKAKDRGVNPVVYEVALDGIAVIVHPSNKIDNLTLQQVADIFTGKITNWKQLGGPDMPITLYGRENSSGTYEFFKDHVLGKDERGIANDYARNTQVLQGTAALGEAVARDVKAIGYGGVGYFAERKDVKILHIKADEDSEAVAPAENGKVDFEAIWSGRYSISRYLYCFADQMHVERITDFMNFVLSDEGQEVVASMEYIPLPPEKRLNYNDK